MLCFPHPSSKDVTNLGTLPQSRECRDVKKLYRNNGHIIIHHGTSINQLEKLFQTHFWVILVIINEVPPIQLTPPQNRVFVPLTVASRLAPGWVSISVTRAYGGSYAGVWEQKLENIGAGAFAGLQLLVSS